VVGTQGMSEMRSSDTGLLTGVVATSAMFLGTTMPPPGGSIQVQAGLAKGAEENREGLMVPPTLAHSPVPPPGPLVAQPTCRPYPGHPLRKHASSEPSPLNGPA
jgi:hypothetical protein